ncbi:MAG: Slp family lipoprotein [Leptospirales bacterium]
MTAPFARSPLPFRGGGHLLSPFFLSLFLLLTLSGCDIFNPPTFTSRQLAGVDLSVDYPQVLSGHRDLAGQKVVVGGEVVRLENHTTRAYVEIAPSPLDRILRPEAPDGSAGLLLLIFPYPVDPSALRDGVRITVTGTVRRMKRPAVTAGGRTARFVTLDVVDLHTWVPPTQLLGGSPYPVMTPGFTGPYQTP